MGSPNPWTTKDCSQGICTIYCPQWCYILYSPPPPSIQLTTYNDYDDDHSTFEFSPLIVALIGILSSTFILVTYYTIISRLCRRRRNMNHDATDGELGQVSSSSSSLSSGLDEALIKSITVMKYTKSQDDGEVVVEGRECSVCLSEFEESESLRLLPRCNHAFHLPCIDTWLKSHDTCPLCRSTITLLPNQSSNSNSSMEPPGRVVINALEYQERSSDVVVVVVQSSEEPETVVTFGDQVVPKLEVQYRDNTQ